MEFLATLVYIYCIIGAIVGAVCWMQEKWPKEKFIEDTVGGLGSHIEIDGNKTALFALLCGPLFWIGGLLFIIFRFVVNLLKEEE